MKKVLALITIMTMLLVNTTIYAKTEYESYMFDIEDSDTDIAMTMWFEYPSKWDIAEGFAVNLIPDADTTMSLYQETDNMDSADLIYLITKDSNNSNIKTEELEDDCNTITKVSYKSKNENSQNQSEQYFHKYYVGVDVDGKAYYFSLGYAGDTPENNYEADMDHIAQTLKVVSFKKKEAEETTSSADEIIIDTYRATYNMKDALNKELEESGLEFKNDVITEFILKLNSDGSFSFDIDGEEFRETFIEAMTKDGPEMINHMLESEGITEDMYETIAIASGYDNYDEFIDEMLKTIIDDLGDSFIEDLEKETHYEGKYKIDGNILIMTGEKGQNGVDKGTINSDGTILIESKMDNDMDLELTFVKETA